MKELSSRSSDFTVFLLPEAGELFLNLLEASSRYEKRDTALGDDADPHPRLDVE